MKRSKHQTTSSKETPGNNVQRFMLLAAGLLFAAPGSWTAFGAQSTDNTPGRTDYRNFEIIPKRNIFNPRRSPAYVPSERPQTVRRRTESLALVGVMSYGKGPMAFFDGSRSDYRKMLKPNESIAGFKVTAIDATSVKLSASTNEIELQLGMQLAREEEGEWKLSMRPESLESTYARATPMRSASQVNADRQSEADQNANPIGNFFPGGGFPNQGFPFGQNPQNQPVATTGPNSQPQVAPANASDILARLAARRQQETGEQPQQDPNTGPTSDQGGPPNPRGQSPQPPQNQPARDSNGQSQPNQPNQLQFGPGQQPLDQPGQPLLDQSGQALLDQSGQPILIQPGQEQPNQ